ncbi:MAG: hypothetical protein JSS86_13565 [Cyanobacteria bacterium SZAS LIN-2]|nr:hypothetical protein [Cyanobacteria bacterium SZAS LIN-2]
MSEIEITRHLYIPEGEPFLEWFDGVFNAVYVALHPFVRVAGENTAPAYLDSTKAEDESNTTYMERRHAEVSRIDRLAKSSGERVPWSKVQADCGLSLPNIVHAVFAEISNDPETQDLGRLLKNYCSTNRLFYPCENSFPAILEDRFCDLWECLNPEEIVISDEFITDTRVVPLAALRTAAPWDQIGLVKFPIKKFYPLDHSFLVATPFDTVYTAICGKRDQLESARVEDLFEGFWCNEQTTGLWWR